ncbi:MAG: DMT family transporter, partial [Alicyclobacillaceae bacterium]|nr:DMT family transporter [Alicyclobacillaceae bacterium]
MAHSGPVPEVRGAGADRLFRLKGFVLVLAAAVLWGLSGTAAQVLFQRYGLRPDWLVAVRMGVSGILLVTGTAIVSGPPAAWAVWRRPGDALRLAVFGLLGLFGVQYSYFASVAAGNAATATLLQYLAPTLIVVYEAWRGRQIPRAWEG